MASRVAPMEAGERDRYVTIQRLVETDEPGFPTEHWEDLAQMWAAKIDVLGRERFHAEQLSARYDTRWEVNYRADLDPDLVDVANERRIVYQGRVYDVVAGSMIGRKAGVELMTLSKVG